MADKSVNQAFNPDIIDELDASLQEVIQFLLHSPLETALTITTPIYRSLLTEIWPQNSRTDTSVTFRVGSHNVVVTAATIRASLNIPEVVDPVLPISAATAISTYRDEIGYVRRNLRAFARADFPHVVNCGLSIIKLCLLPRTGGQEAVHGSILQAHEAIFRQRNIDWAQFIFAELHRVATGTTVHYARFVSRWIVSAVPLAVLTSYPSIPTPFISTRLFQLILATQAPPLPPAAAIVVPEAAADEDSESSESEIMGFVGPEVEGPTSADQTSGHQTSGHQTSGAQTSAARSVEFLSSSTPSTDEAIVWKSSTEETGETSPEEDFTEASVSPHNSSASLAPIEPPQPDPATIVSNVDSDVPEDLVVPNSYEPPSWQRYQPPVEYYSSEGTIGQSSYKPLIPNSDDVTPTVTHTSPHTAHALPFPYVPHDISESDSNTPKDHFTIQTSKHLSPVHEPTAMDIENSSIQSSPRPLTTRRLESINISDESSGFSAPVDKGKQKVGSPEHLQPTSGHQTSGAQTSGHAGQTSAAPSKHLRPLVNVQTAQPTLVDTPLGSTIRGMVIQYLRSLGSRIYNEARELGIPENQYRTMAVNLLTMQFQNQDKPGVSHYYPPASTQEERYLQILSYYPDVALGSSRKEIIRLSLVHGVNMRIAMDQYREIYAVDVETEFTRSGYWPFPVSATPVTAVQPSPGRSFLHPVILEDDLSDKEAPPTSPQPSATNILTIYHPPASAAPPTPTPPPIPSPQPSPAVSPAASPSHQTSEPAQTSGQAQTSGPAQTSADQTHTPAPATAPEPFSPLSFYQKFPNFDPVPLEQLVAPDLNRVSSLADARGVLLFAAQRLQAMRSQVMRPEAPYLAISEMLMKGHWTMAVAMEEFNKTMHQNSAASTSAQPPSAPSTSDSTPAWEPALNALTSRMDLFEATIIRALARQQAAAEAAQKRHEDLLQRQQAEADIAQKRLEDKFQLLVNALGSRLGLTPDDNKGEKEPQGETVTQGEESTSEGEEPQDDAGPSSTRPRDDNDEEEAERPLKKIAPSKNT